MASYANKAVRNLPSGTPLRVSVKQYGSEKFISVLPSRSTAFKEATCLEFYSHKEMNSGNNLEELRSRYPFCQG